MQLKARGKTYHVAIHQNREDLPLLVLLHGFLGSGEVFTHLLPDLKEFANPVTIDLPGHGITEGGAGPERYQTKEQVEDMRVILNSFHPDPVYLHGYSMGGRLALQYASAYPDTISGLILESTTWGISDADERAGRRRLDEQRAASIEADYTQFLDEWARLPLFNSGIDVPDLLRSRYERIRRAQDPRSMAGSLRGFGTGSMPSAEPYINRLNMPVLILAGEADHTYSALAKEMHQAIPGSTMSVIEKAGHRVHLENPEAFIGSVRSFLEHSQKPRIKNSDS